MARKALAGFFLSGLLYSFLGAILPVWRHHLTEDFLTVGNYFLSMNLGILASFWLAIRLHRRRTALGHTLAMACSLACGGLLALALIPEPVSPWWRMAGILVIGCGAGLLNTAVFQTITPLYRREPAVMINLAGTFFGLGCVVMAILVAGTFYVYSVLTILVFIALIPGVFIPFYARCSVPPEDSEQQPSWRQALSDFRSPSAVLFALLLFFQFGNEWAIAGWLPLFLILRLGISPESTLVMLAVYWLALLAGRALVQSLLPRLNHGRLLFGSAVAALLGCTVLVFTDNAFGAVSGILLVGGGFAPVYPLVVEKIGGRFPYYHPGFFNGIFSIGLTGGLLAPWSLGFFTDLWGIRAVMGLPQLGTVMVVVLLLLIWAEAKFASAPKDLE
jgi:fucose permease